MPSKPTIPRVCETCGKDFFVAERFVKPGHARFCSRQCAADARRGYSARATCEHCGKEFAITPYFASGTRQARFCSRACHNAPRPLRPHPTDPTAMIVPLTQGQEAVIDASDSELVSGHKWQFENGYASAAVKDGAKYKHVKMHAVILGVIDGRLPDHADGNGLNNRRSNLRPATSGQNAANRRRQRKSASGFKGVHQTKYGTWAAYAKRDGRMKHIGSFQTAEDAARAYDDAARELHGTFAAVNFPNDGERQA